MLLFWLHLTMPCNLCLIVLKCLFDVHVSRGHAFAQEVAWNLKVFLYTVQDAGSKVLQPFAKR
jgi:hypothetical protein